MVRARPRQNEAREPADPLEQAAGTNEMIQGGRERVHLIDELLGEETHRGGVAHPNGAVRTADIAAALAGGFMTGAYAHRGVDELDHGQNVRGTGDLLNAAGAGTGAVSALIPNPHIGGGVGGVGSLLGGTGGMLGG